MKICTKCGTENPYDNKFCDNCGTELTDNCDRAREPGFDKSGDNGFTKLHKRRHIAIMIIACIVLLTAIAVVVIMHSMGNDRADYNTKIDEANKYMEALEYEKAEALYLAAIKIEPKEAEAYDKLADIYIVQEKYDKAVDILNEGLEHTEPEVEENLKPKLTYAIYEPVKQDYRDQMIELFNAFEDINADWDKLQEEIDFNYEYFEVMYKGIEDIYDNEDFGFAYEDIDNNGIEEMLVFMPSLSAIWTNDGEKAVCLIRGNSKYYCTISILEDKKIFESIHYGNGITEGVNGDENIYEINREGTELERVEHYIFMAREGTMGIEVYYEKEDGTRVDENIIPDHIYDEFESYDIELLFQ